MEANFRLADISKDLDLIYALRREVFVKEDHYPPEAIVSDFDMTGIHFIAEKDKKVVGAVMVMLDSTKGLPIEKHIEIPSHKNTKIAEILKLAVLSEERKGATSLGLMVLAYEFAKESGAKRIYISCLEKKKDNIKLYSKFGFKNIGKFNYYNVDNAYGMVLDLEASVYEKDRKKNARREMLAKKLSDNLSAILKGQ